MSESKPRLIERGLYHPNRHRPIPPDLAAREIPLSENARTVLKKRYLRRGPDGQPVESIPEMFWRVAWHVAQPDADFGGGVYTTARRFYDLLTDLRFMPNSPTFTGAGTPLGQLAACFVLPIEDDMGKLEGGIFDTLRNAALIQQTGGGNGFAFSRLRPKGAFVHTSAGRATGPVGFLRVYDKAFGEIAQGGSRRGANMAVLRVDHPDIREFIRCKAVEGDVTNFNISVGITDAFMEAVEKGTTFDLVGPHDGQVYETVDARELFEEIVRYAHRNGEPGVLFLDAANRTNPVPHLYELEATNPCGEQWLGPYENCCLGSVNLAPHVSEDGVIDWEGLAETVRTSTHFLDNVVSANTYVPAVPELKEAAFRARRIGLGIMGLGDVMFKLGVRYGSREGLELAAQLMEFVRFHSMKHSIELAQERGPFEAISGSIYDPANLKWQPPRPLFPYEHNWGRPPINWSEIVGGISEHGIRNAAQTTVAPTGTISTVAGIEGYGCEPVFALAYTRWVNDGDDRLQLTYTSPLFERALARAGLDAESRQQVSELVSVTGSAQGIAEVPEELRHAFVVASDITPEEHVHMQAAIQAFVDNSLSKTINFPNTATADDVATAYKLAWKLGCKGITVYVTGSRETVVLETKQTSQAKQEGAPAIQAATQPEATTSADPAPIPAPVLKPEPAPMLHDHIKKPRPHRLPGATYYTQTPLGKAYITVNRNGNNQPFEVFANVGKAGSDTASVSEAIGRLISLVLRLPSNLSPSERLQHVVNELGGIGGGRHLGFGANRVLSLPDAIARVLQEDLQSYLDEAETGAAEAAEGYVEQLDLSSPSLHADLCPECGHASLVNEEGCRKCYSCAYSEC